MAEFNIFELYLFITTLLKRLYVCLYIAVFMHPGGLASVDWKQDKQR